MLKFSDGGNSDKKDRGVKTVAEITSAGYKYELVRTKIDTNEDTRRNLYGATLEQHEKIPVLEVPLKQFMRDFEREILRVTLVALDWNKLLAAKYVGMKRTTFVEKLRSRGLHPTTESMLKTQGVIKK